MTNNESNNKGFVGTGPYSPTTTFDKSLALRIDGGINAVSIAPSGRDVVLASKHGIYIVDLDDPYELPRFLEHQTPWQVADVQYSPHLETASWVISTSNQKALIWNLMRSAGNAIEHTLHGHYRAITDINWHPQNYNLLSTASVDTTVLAWDLRNSKKPIYKTADWRASASQVKWNLKNGNVLASSHDNYISLWDIRKGTKPFIQLKGHTSSVNNISFNPKNEFELMSSSNDGTIKIWNYKDDTYENYQKQNVATDFPVWRGRYLPFGDGFCAIPIVGGNNSVYLANNNGEENSKISPVYVFKGHNDRITDFLWRSRHQEQNIDDREFQLVTWSNDSDLRLWPIPETVYEKVNFSRKEPLDTPLIDYPYKTFSKDVKFNNKNLNVQDNIYKFPKEKFTTKSGRFVKEDIDHLSWLSGVRVDEDNIDNNNNNNNNNNALYDYFDDEDDYYMDGEGDESLYGNLGEEVAKVGSKFHMVSFEKISVSTGDIVVTLNGPWNSLSKDQLAFIRAIIHFDSKYPKGGPPKVCIEESREITNEQRLKMEQELSNIGKIYTDSKQNCLEQLFKFLLGEKVDMNPENTKKIRANVAEYDIMKNLGLDEEDIWNLEDIKNEKQSNVTGSEYTHEDGEEREYGNDDDDDDDDIAIDNPTNIAKKKKFDSTPVPKGCGAVFSPNGQLVYFFTSTNSDKQKKIEDQIFNVSAGGIRGFGKINKQESEKSDRDTISTTGINNSSIEKKPKTYFESLELKNKKKEEYNKNNGKKNLGMGMSNFADEDEWDTILKSDLTFRTKISVAPDRAKERINMDAEYEKPNSSHSSVTIKDYSHLIPDKKELALRYKTHGESLPLVCSHNAAVARQFNLHDIGTCWEMIGAMLKSKSKDLLKHEDWSYDIDGGKQFLNDVFQFFEKSHNVQMLALLSCILVASGRPEDIDNKDEENDIMYINGDVSFESNTYYNNSGKKIAHSRDSLLMRQNSIFSHSIHSNMNMSMHSNSHSSIHNGNIPNPIPGLKIDVLKSELLNNGNVYYPKTQKFIYNKLELLDKKREARCITYRDQYAELLYCWGFQAERSNILRFNINENSNEEYLRKIDEKDLFKGLEIVPTKPLMDKNCKVCDEPVVKRSFVCNKCGCLTHAECAKMWWDNKTGSSDNPCPSGCGCECLALYQKKI